MNEIRCNVIEDGPLPGQRNMEVDAEMLQHAVNGTSTVRTYQWSEPTISLGHFQVKTVSHIPDRFADLAVVQRLSGGGAILHDQELTYSLAVPNSHELAKTPSLIYNVVHKCIISLLESEGIKSQMRGDAAFADKPFLCFGRGDERDIVIGENKIVGSAQRRRQGAVLQHGSLLLRQSPHAPEFPGVEDLTGKQLSVQDFTGQLRRAMIETLRLSM